MDLVVGATGLLGAEVCRQLLKRGREVRGLVRKSSDAKKLRALQALGVELAYGDLKQPSSLRSACSGIHSVVTTASATQSRAEGDDIASVDGRGTLELIAAASSARVEHFVFTSFYPLLPDFPLQRVKRDAERALAAGNMPWTVLQPTHFMEVWLSPALGFDLGARSARVFAGGQRPLRWVSLKDVARVAVAAVVAGPQRRALAFGGPAALSQRDVIAHFEQASGRRWQIEEVPEAALRGQYDTTKNALEKSFAAMMLACGSGEPMAFDNSSLRGIVEEPLISVPEFVRSSLEGHG